jgi:hypothetical protein
VGVTPSRKSYSRYFIILQEEQKGYGLDNDKAPSGYAKLEVKNNKSKISFYVQNLKKDKGPYNMVLITDKQEPRNLINLGRLNIDDNGRADVSFEYDMNNIANTNIAMDRIIGAAVVTLNGKTVPVMVGFSTSDVPKDWATYPIAKATQPATTGTGAGTTTQPSTGTTTGAGAGTTTQPSTGTTTGTGAGTTTQPNAGTTTGTGAGTTTQPGMGTTTGTGAGTTTQPGMGTKMGTGAGTTTQPGMGTTTGTGAGTTMQPGMGTTTGPGIGITTQPGIGATTGTGVGTTTQPGMGTTTPSFDGFEDDFDDFDIIDVVPAENQTTVPNTRDIFDRYEEEIESTKFERDKNKECKHEKHHKHDKHNKHDKDDKHYDCYEEHKQCADYDDEDYCMQHKHYHEEDPCMNDKHYHDEDDCMEHKHHHDEDFCMDHKYHRKSDDYMNKNKQTMDHMDENKQTMDHMDKYSWPIGNTGDFFKKVVKGFEKLGENENIKNCFWYKVQVNKLEEMYCIHDYNKYTVVFYPMISYYPYISKRKHFMIGYKCDDEGRLRYIIYAIPGTKAIDDQPYGGKTGFVTWMPNEDESEMGHWLMYYDFKTNNIVIPIKRS